MRGSLTPLQGVQRSKGVIVQRVGSRVKDHSSALEPDHTIEVLPRQIFAVQTDHECQFILLGEPHQELDQRRGPRGINARHRLIRQHDPRLLVQRARHRDPLTLTTREG